MKLSKEDYIWLRDNVERHLSTTYYLKYKVATPHKDNLMVAEILERTTGQPVNKNFVCGSCLYNVYNRMAQIYFQYKEELEKKEEEIKKKRQENAEKARQSKNNKLINEQ